MGAVGLVFGIGFLGGLLGAALARRRADPGTDKLTRLEAKVNWLYRQQERLLERVAQIEWATRSPSVAPPEAPLQPAVPVTPVQPPEPEGSMAKAGPAEPVDTEPAAAVRPSSEQRAGPPVSAPPRIDTDKTTAAAGEPNLLSRLLFGGNTLVRLGVVILFFGIAFLMKHTYERVQVPVELRLTGVAVAAVILLALGWRLRASRPGYALALQGGGIGVLYLTVFSALRLFGVLPPVAALVLLTLLAVLSALLALLQNSAALAMLGAGGGFLAPVLASTGGGSHVQLFSYYALLNAGILLIAWHRAWRGLNLLGFAFTFVIGGMWGWKYYRPELFASTEPFLVLFFLMYVAIPVLYGRREATSRGAYVDTTLVFGVPLVGFGLQLALVREHEFGAAWSALALGAFYLGLAAILRRRAGGTLNLLFESFLALGVVFVTLAVPLGFEGRWTAAVWALEGAAILWISVRQQRLLGRVFALVLQFAAGTAFLLDLPSSANALPVLNSACLGGTLIAFSALFSAWYLERHGDRLRTWEPAAALALFLWGILWWAGTGLLQIDHHVAFRYRFHASLLFLSGSWALLSLIARLGAWRVADRACLALAPMLAAGTLMALSAVSHPSAGLGVAAWPCAFAVHLSLLRRHEMHSPGLAPLLHAVGLCCLALLAAWELAWWIERAVEGSSAWPLIAWALVPALLVLGLSAYGQRITWPVVAQRGGYLVLGCVALLLFLLGWALYATVNSDGSAAPLPYVVLLNPLDLMLVGLGLIAIRWLMEVRRLELMPSSAPQPFLLGLLGAAAFIVANGMLLRALHHWAGVPFDFDVMLGSVKVQTAFSVFWTVLALVAMVAAARRSMRTLWLVGAGLMGVVVVKLFLIDLSNVGGIERIVSFIGVGVLMLVIGYFSPVPPKSKEAT
jgi:uncharacterized membrane protein